MNDIIITVSAGAPVVEPGTYPVTLIGVEVKNINTVDGPLDIIEWLFSLDDGTEVKGSSSTASGPKSKCFAWLVALGADPVPGKGFASADLVGRMALAKIVTKQSGYSAVETLIPMPKGKPAAVAEEEASASLPF